MQSRENLIICLTSFQMFLASKIVEKSDGKFKLLYIEHTESTKNEYYFNQLARMVDEAKIYKVRKRNVFLKCIFFILFIFRNFIFFRGLKSIYFATINDSHIYLFLKIFGYKELITFDDGAANIFKDGGFFRSSKKLNFIKKNTIKHYSIYKGMDNIVPKEKIQYLDLLKRDVVRCQNYESISIFLGQPYQEFFNRDVNCTALVHLFEKLGIDFYYPHPREFFLIKNVKYINSPLIFEEYVIELLKDKGKVKVYTFTSSAVLNIANIENIELTSVVTTDLLENYKKLFDIYQENGIKLLKVELND